ncbi:MAG: hypothetical protein ACYC2H_02050 [Thermoplasmatota archaeon]
MQTNIILKARDIENLENTSLAMVNLGMNQSLTVITPGILDDVGGQNCSYYCTTVTVCSVYC